METNLLDRMLNTYLTSRSPVTITLQNKIRVSGRINAFDSYVIVLENQKREILYRHAVSCITAATSQEEPKRPRLRRNLFRPGPVPRPPTPDRPPAPAFSAAAGPFRDQQTPLSTTA